MNNTQRQSIEQKRAKYAFDCAKDKSEEYKSAVDKVPTYIKINGLLNTLVFLYSKKSSGKNEEVLNQIINWLEKKEITNDVSERQQIAFLEGLMDSNVTNTSTMIRHTSEVLALFNWLRRFAKK